MNGSLHRITYYILRSLLRILHLRGVSFGEFSQIAKHAFVSVAEDELKKSGARVTTSRIAITTGLTRKEVSAIRKSADEQQVSDKHFNRSIRVATGWMADTVFQNEEGKAAVLPLIGGECSFESLVTRYSGDMPYRAMLDEMQRAGIVALEDGQVRLLAEGFLSVDEQDKLEILKDDVTALLDTIGFNLKAAPDEERRFQRKVKYDNLPREVLPDFIRLVNKEGMALLLKLNDYLSRYDRDAYPETQGSGRYEAGVGVYYFESDGQEDDKSHVK